MSVYYNFKNVAELVDLLCLVFDTVNGHDHDGTNSKAVTTGTPADSAVTTAKIAAGALAASAAGRGKIADDFFDAATVLAKFDADSFTNAVLLLLIADGAFVADASTRALFADGFLPPAKMTATANTRVVNYQVEDLAANADIAGRALLEVPTGMVFTITDARIISHGAAAGIDAGNTCAVAIKNGSNAIATATYDNATPFPDENASGSLGALNATYKVLAAGEKLVLAVTNGATANPPAFMLQVTFTIADA